MTHYSDTVKCNAFSHYNSGSFSIKLLPLSPDLTPHDFFWSYMKGVVHVPPFPTILPEFAARNTICCVCRYTGHVYRLSGLNFNTDMMCECVRTCVRRDTQDDINEHL